MSKQFTISEERIELAIGANHYRPTLACKWLADVAQEFDVIANLRAGWDTYGAPQPDLKILNTGWSLLLSLCDKAVVPRPCVNPTRTGGIQFEWEEETRYFEIEVVDEATAVYFYRDDDMACEEEGELTVGNPLDEILDYIARCGVVRRDQWAATGLARSSVDCGWLVEVPA